MQCFTTKILENSNVDNQKNAQVLNLTSKTPKDFELNIINKILIDSLIPFQNIRNRSKSYQEQRVKRITKSTSVGKPKKKKLHQVHINLNFDA